MIWLLRYAELAGVLTRGFFTTAKLPDCLVASCKELAAKTGVLILRRLFGHYQRLRNKFLLPVRPMWIKLSTRLTWHSNLILVPHLLMWPHGILRPLRYLGSIALVVRILRVQEQALAQEGLLLEVDGLLSHDVLLVVDSLLTELLILNLRVRDVLVEVRGFHKVG